jgi:hypothetical protein
MPAGKFCNCNKRGISPKEFERTRAFRARVHEAAERLRRGEGGSDLRVGNAA